MKQRPVGMPTENDFEPVKVDVPELEDETSRFSRISSMIYAPALYCSNVS
ncbi:MAG: hypothetical protein ACM3X1_09950 [Ignavibacteriales bacterium]